MNELFALKRATKCQRQQIGYAKNVVRLRFSVKTKCHTYELFLFNQSILIKKIVYSLRVSSVDEKCPLQYTLGDIVILLTPCPGLDRYQL